jgi:hypothetical protein
MNDFDKTLVLGIISKTSDKNIGISLCILCTLKTREENEVFFHLI